MLANADAVIAAAQTNLIKMQMMKANSTLEAQAEEGILTSRRFRSEQLINVNSLLREQEDLKEQEKDLEKKNF